MMEDHMTVARMISVMMNRPADSQITQPGGSMVVEIPLSGGFVAIGNEAGCLI
jgi:hypothetical protein